MAKLLTGTRIYGTATVDTQLFISGTTASTSTTTGALQVSGGTGIAGALYVGGAINGNLTGNVTGNITGTVNTASQPNITSLGTLTGLTTSGQFTSTIATGTAPLVIASTTRVANLNVATAGSADALSVGSANQIIYKNGSNVTSGSSGLTFDGSLLSTGVLASTNSSGDEGGEIQLAKPATNTTLASTVIIDIYQNRLRFFEQGGTARGYYIDLTTGTASAGTNLVGAGGGGTSTTITVDTFTGTGSQTAFTLTAAPIGVNYTIVTINGVAQQRTQAYTVSGTTLTFTEAPPIDAVVEVSTFSASISGVANQLSTGRTISITGDISYTSGSFNGSANVTGTATLANTSVTPGTYVLSTVTVDSKGRITDASGGIGKAIALNAGLAML